MSRRERSDYRSVRDYDTEHSLRQALLAMQSDGYEGRKSPEAAAATETTTTSQRDVGDVSNIGGEATAAATPLEEDGKIAAVAAAGNITTNLPVDWDVSTLNPDTTEVQSMKEELQRLLVLKSYLILDSEREAAFERLTGLASRIFKVPISLVSVVDLGRIWFMSNRGLGDVREAPRRYAFCAHAITSKEGMLVVPDATQDVRFKDNQFVTGPPCIRFYAGAVRVSVFFGSLSISFFCSIAYDVVNRICQ